MIVSHKHKFIFLKTPKAAGTSVEIALSKACGPEDIITPISAVDEEKRLAQGGRPPQNYRPGMLKRLLGEGDGFSNHTTAEQARLLLPAEVWDRYHKFAVVRNPWDQVASLYFWRNKKGHYNSFEEFLADDRVDRIEARTRAICQLDGEFALDGYLRFESLQDTLNEELHSIGVEDPPQLIKTKGGLRKDGGDFRTLYDQDSRERIGRSFAWLIDRFGYVFE